MNVLQCVIKWIITLKTPDERVIIFKKRTFGRNKILYKKIVNKAFKKSLERNHRITIYFFKKYLKIEK